MIVDWLCLTVVKRNPLRRNAAAIQLRHFGLGLYSRQRRASSSIMLPPRDKLAASLLLSPVKMIMQSATDRETETKLFKDMCMRLELEGPKALDSQFEDLKEYSKSYATLVAEETRYSIATELNKRFGDKRTPSNGVTIRFTESYIYFRAYEHVECWTMKPLSRQNRSDFKAGAVVALRRATHDKGSDDLFLGRIQYGSTASSPRKSSRN